MPSKSPHPELECLWDCHVTSWTLFIKYYESMTRKVNTIHPSWKGFTCNHLPGVNGPGWLVFQLVYKTQRTLQETQTQCLNHAIKKSCIMSGKALEDFKTSTIPSCYPIPSAQQFAAVFFLIYPVPFSQHQYLQPHKILFTALTGVGRRLWAYLALNKT